MPRVPERLRARPEPHPIGHRQDVTASLKGKLRARTSWIVARENGRDVRAPKEPHARRRPGGPTRRLVKPTEDHTRGNRTLTSHPCSVTYPRARKPILTAAQPPRATNPHRFARSRQALPLQAASRPCQHLTQRAPPRNSRKTLPLRPNAPRRRSRRRPLPDSHTLHAPGCWPRRRPKTSRKKAPESRAHLLGANGNAISDTKQRPAQRAHPLDTGRPTRTL